MLVIMTVDIISIFKPFLLEGEQSLKRCYIKMCCGMEYYSVIKKNEILLCYSHMDGPSVQFSCSVVSNSLRLSGLQHARPRCSSPTPGVYSSSYPLSQWCHPTISSFVVPFSSGLQSFPASGSFPMSQSLLQERLSGVRASLYWTQCPRPCSTNVTPSLS